MSLKLPRFGVLLTADNPDDDPVVHEVTILHADQLRSELEGPKHRIPEISVAPMHYTTLWVWCALVRTGAVSDKFDVFKNRVLTLEGLDDDEGALDGEPATPADPTTPAVDIDSP